MAFAAFSNPTFSSHFLNVPASHFLLLSWFPFPPAVSIFTVAPGPSSLSLFFFSPYHYCPSLKSHSGEGSCKEITVRLIGRWESNRWTPNNERWLRGELLRFPIVLFFFLLDFSVFIYFLSSAFARHCSSLLLLCESSCDSLKVNWFYILLSYCFRVFFVLMLLVPHIILYSDFPKG